MTINYFKHLNELDKINALITEGRVIGETSGEQERAFLYQIGAFYVLVAYHAQTDELLRIEIFSACAKKRSPKLFFRLQDDPSRSPYQYRNQ